MKISSAIDDLIKQGFDPTNLYNPFCKLLSIGHACQDEGFLSRAIVFIHAPYDYDWSAMKKEAESRGIIKV